MNSTTKKIAIYLISLICLILIIYLVSYTVGNDIIFPTPFDSFLALIDLLKSKNTYVTIGYTFLRLLITLVISFIIGGSLGILAGRFGFIRSFLKPWILIFRSLPLAAIIVIIMVVLGFDLSPYIICMLMLIPIIYEAFLNGILSLDKDLMQVWRLESNMNLKVLINIIFPLAKPFIRTAFSQSVGLGIKVLVMAEFICNTRNSIGQSLANSANYLEYDKVFAWSFIAIIFVIIVESIPKLFEYINNKKTI